MKAVKRYVCFLGLILMSVSPATGLFAQDQQPILIKMMDNQFVDKDGKKLTSVPVKVNTKITWKNEDACTAHNVTFKGDDIKKLEFGDGESKTITVTQDLFNKLSKIAEPDGKTVNYRCTIHPGMKSSLTLVK